MQIIEQSHEIIDRGIGPLKLIELCGRTCYKSESKITDDSAQKFVASIIKNGHLSVLEHATACLKTPYNIGEYICTYRDRHFLNITQKAGDFYISGNLRAFREFCLRNIGYGEDGSFAVLDNNIHMLMQVLGDMHPWLFSDKKNLPYIGLHPDTFEKIMPIFSKSEWGGNINKHTLKHVYETVRFITNRGVTHELVRHRPASYSQESTRYVKYGANGHGMEFIKPVWFDSSTELTQKIWETACVTAEAHYIMLLDEKWRPEQAREVLPNSLKTEIVVTANLQEWKHIFKLRCSKAAHPQIRELMRPVEKYFNDKYGDFI